LNVCVGRLVLTHRQLLFLATVYSLEEKNNDVQHIRDE
jgi:hypothetical protein